MSFHYMEEGYRVRVTESTEARHWQGGEAYHKGAWCPNCRKPLLLLWDLDCTDPQLAEHFGKLRRLPLYYCWTCCVATLAYRVISPKRVEVIIAKAGQEPDPNFPYEDFPLAFERRPIELERIPYEIEKLLFIYSERYHLLSSHEEKTLMHWLKYDRRWRYVRDLSVCVAYLHQFGGTPILIQGHEIHLCPNPRCRNYQLWERYNLDCNLEALRMKELAVIHDDPHSGLDMTGSNNPWVEVVFWICEGCFTILSANRCD